MKDTPLLAIRKYCLWCMNGSSKEVEQCPSKDCPLYPLRFGKRLKGYSPLKAIRKKCLDCGEKTPFAVKNCEFKHCPLYKYRLGKNPARRGIGRKGGNPSLKGGVRLEKKAKVGI
ncbi:MAG: hypothetical protein ACTSR2_01825 [Candidatus Hodarchaeales archaeon]